MSTPLVVTLVLLALVVVGVVVREIRVRRRLRRDGIRCRGTVVGHTTDSPANVPGERPVYFPVVAFTDEESGRRVEVRGKSGLAWRHPKVGRQVSVVYLPGRPDAARFTSVRLPWRIFLVAVAASTASVIIILIGTDR